MTCSLRSPGFFYWRIVFRNRGLGAGTLCMTDIPLLSVDWEIYPHVLTHAGTHDYVYFSTCPAVCVRGYGYELMNSC